MRSLKLILLLIIGYLFIFPSSLSAELSNFQFEIIKIAFMNGYSNAIQGDIETIKVLKQDQEKLKKFSRFAVNQYMERVALLNRNSQEADHEKDTAVSASNSISF